MYSQAYSLVGETLNNRVLDSYREGFADASEVSVHSPTELLDIFESYHFEPTEVTDEFTLLADNAAELGDIYKSLYKYSYANPDTVCVERQSVSEYMTWNSVSAYLEEVYNRIFTIVDNAHKYDMDTSELQDRFEKLARNLFVYVNMTRTSMLTRFTIKADEEPTFIFVELPEKLHTEVYPVWYLANSLGILPPLEKPLSTEFTAPEELPEMFYTITLPNTARLCKFAKDDNRFVATTGDVGSPTVMGSPTDVFSTLTSRAQRSHQYAKELIWAYQQALRAEVKQSVIAD